MENSRNVSIPHPENAGKSLAGYLAMPVKTPAPGILVLHEAAGLNDNMRDIARRFSEAGYVALAADLFSDGNKMVCMIRAFYGLLASPLKNSTVNKVRATFDYLSKIESVDQSRVGAIGFCMGGSYAIQLACLDHTVRAISVVSAQNPRPLDALQRACPIVGSFSDRDLTTGAGHRLDQVLGEYKIPHDIKFYTGAIHSMFRDSAKGYNPEISADAWKRTLGFFQEHMHVKSV